MCLEAKAISAQDSATLYLDSSDYSTLSNEKTRHEHIALYNIIDELVDRGHLVCPLSPIHLSENAPSSIGSLEKSLGRAGLMRRWSKSAQLVFPHDIIESEVTSYDGQKPFELDFWRSPKEKWFGLDLAFNPDALRVKTIQNASKTILSSKLPRWRRRELAHGLKDSNSEIMNLIYDNIVSTPKFDPPLDIIDKKTAANYIVGRVSSEQFRSESAKIIADPYRFYQLVSEDTDTISKLFTMIREPGQHMIGLLKELTDKLRYSYHEMVRLSKILDRHLPDPTSYMKDSNLDIAILTILDGRLEQIPKREIPHLLSKCPSLRICYNTFYRYIARAAQSVKSDDDAQISSSIGKASFYGDIMHLAYAPYMTFHRSDRTIKGLILKDDPTGQSVYADRRLLISSLENLRLTRN